MTAVPAVEKSGDCRLWIRPPLRALTANKGGLFTADSVVKNLERRLATFLWSLHYFSLQRRVSACEAAAPPDTRALEPWVAYLAGVRPRERRRTDGRTDGRTAR